MPSRSNYRRGAAHPQSKLNENQIREITRAYDRGGITYRQLANQYGVSTSTINDVLNHRTWRHLRAASKEK